MQAKVDQLYNGDELYELVSQYHPSRVKGNHVLELEYKIRVDQKMFIAILDSFRGQDMTLEQTTNALYKVNTGVGSERINFVVSKDYATNKITKYIKRRLIDANCDDFTNIMMSVSTETPFVTDNKVTNNSKPAGVNKVELYRIKNRLSFVCGDWRYDFTQTAQLSPNDRFFNDNSVKITANSIFSSTTKFANSEALLDEFIKSCANPAVKTFELEVELIAPLKPIHLSTHSFLNDLGSNQQFVKERLYYNVIISGVARSIDTNPKVLSLKRLTNAAETLTKSIYNSIFPPISWYLSWKADGKRGLLTIMRDGTIFMLLSDKVHQLNNFDNGVLANEFVGSGHYDRFTPVVVIDGEFIETKKRNAFLVWNCLVYNGKTIIDRQFADSYSISASCCEQFTNLPIDVLPKRIYIITEDIHTSVKRAIEDKFPFPNDGFILTEPNKNYYNTRCFKIKEHNTIDFLIIEHKLKGEGDKDTFLLFCSISPHMLESMRITQLPYYSKLFRVNSFKGRVPVHFCPADNPHAYVWHPTKAEAKEIRDTIEKSDPTRPWVIGELVYGSSGHAQDSPTDKLSLTWKLERIRHDRYNEPNYYGNDFTKVALHNWEAIRNPVKVEELHMCIANYFKTGKDEYYHAQTTAMSFAKYRIFELLTSASPGHMKDCNVIDFAFGKGQDLNKYIQHKVTSLLAIDVDRVALSEGLTRYYEAINRRNSNVNMSMTIIEQDLTAKHDLVFDKIDKIWLSTSTNLSASGTKVYPQYLICNLALHYFIRDINELTNFASLLKSLMASGSKFMYTTFDGKKVFDLLSGCQDGEWIARVEGSVKYRIVRKYTNTEFGEFGQTIQVKLPFTNDEMYEENLVNVDSVNFAFTQMGMKVVAQGSFADFFDSLAAEQPAVWRRLNDEDKKFISLYQYTILGV